MLRSARAWWFLVLFSARRQLVTRRNWISVVLVALCAVFVYVIRRSQAGLEVTDFGEWILHGLFGAFVFPAVLLGFGTGALGQEREEGTLHYLFCRPLWRWSVYLAKYLGALPASLLFALGGLVVVGEVAIWSGGASGIRTLILAVLPAYACATLAYLALFQLLTSLFSRATLIAVVYVFLVEVFLGQVPGIIKRLSIRYYTSSMVEELGAPAGLLPPEGPVATLPLAADSAQAVILSIAGVLLALGAVVFAQREYERGAA